MSSENDGRAEVEGGDALGESETPVSSKPWVSLQTFKVECQGYENIKAPVYANGRQEVPIQIKIVALDANGVQVVVADDASLDLRLVSYDTPSNYPPPNTQIFKKEDTRYVYNHVVQSLDEQERNVCAVVEVEAGGQEVVEEPKWTVQTFTRWVRRTQLGVMKLAASVTTSGGIEMISNSSTVAPGKFNSFVAVLGLASDNGKDYKDFGITRYDSLNTSYWDVDMYEIRFNDPKWKIVASYNMTVSDGHHYSWDKDGYQSMQIAFKVVPEDRTVTITACKGAIPAVQVRVSNANFRAWAARAKHRSTCGGYSSKHCWMAYYDQYGHETIVKLIASPNGNTMSLGDPNSREVENEELPSAPE